jgi:peptidyl-tRNA hydrolase, PTH2 family
VGKKTKQVIVMRTDTNPPMRKGKMVAQGAHASIAFLTRRIERLAVGERYPQGYDGDPWAFLDLTWAMREWMADSFAKVCCRCDSLDDLMAIKAKAEAAGLEVHLVTDSGRTEFSEPTVTCLAIGPDYVDRIDPITGHLKLL